MHHQKRMTAIRRLVKPGQKIIVELARMIPEATIWRYAGIVHDDLGPVAVL